MIFDDHDVHDDWNTSDAWVARSAQQPLVATSASSARYVVLLDLPAHRQPLARATCATTSSTRRSRAAEDAEPSRCASSPCRAEREVERRAAGASGATSARRGSSSWTRAPAACSSRGRREMLDDAEWQLARRAARPATSTTCSSGRRCRSCSRPACTISRRGTRRSPAGPGAGWRRGSARSCARASTSSTGRRSSGSFRRLERGSHRGRPPAGAGARRPSIVLLSGDVHHAYVAEARSPPTRRAERRRPG